MSPIQKSVLTLLALSTLLGGALSHPATAQDAETSSAEPPTTTTKKRIVNVGIGDHCAPGAAPVGPNGSWQIVETDVEKVCAEGTSCRMGACNCDDLKDGTVTGMSVDQQDGKRSCRRIANQKCSADGDCFHGVPCKEGLCTCDNSIRKDLYCVDRKNDVAIMSRK